MSIFPHPLGGKHEDLPQAFNGCTCSCHRVPGVLHVRACCSPTTRNPLHPRTETTEDTGSRSPGPSYPEQLTPEQEEAEFMKHRERDAAVRLQRRLEEQRKKREPKAERKNA